MQVAVDFYDCDPAILDDEAKIRTFMLEAARRCNVTIVSECFHRFSPHGVSGVVIIAESHLAIHTWPEHRYAAVDLFTCGDKLRSEDWLVYLREMFGSSRSQSSTIERGPRHLVSAPPR